MSALEKTITGRWFTHRGDVTGALFRVIRSFRFPWVLSKNGVSLSGERISTLAGSAFRIRMEEMAVLSALLQEEP